VTKEQRSAAKRINFGLMYGRGAKSLSAQLGTDDERARTLIDEYFANYPKVQRYLQRTANRALRDRTLRTLAGRVRKFGDTSGLGLRRAGRAPARGDELPDPGQLGRYRQARPRYVETSSRGLDARLINCIHDEFVVECIEETAPEVAERMKAAMNRAGEEILEKVPVEVEVAISREWRK
jgi:DNA polymerase-1